ncbi:RGS-domain-containing protein [Naegleria gruberi]|uniref:RGS-domain-containing protein n=1 Tax=Naegleria gruberi TaxID=5762 RepID=D2VLB5_NAEGR|nr:RGS-domain-containing protein [Naegleria gruberi]EFC42358.1 RGS-domain-containing protein [Naegleria gruberi]|eukprot:XP_002675102.1 RGS-domain-containing protein [Naegleria gruberi strain NEG-M]
MPNPTSLISLLSVAVLLHALLLLLLSITTTAKSNPSGSFKYSTTSTLLAGGMSLNSLNKYGDGLDAKMACLDTIEVVKMGSNNTIYIVDSGHDVIRRISSDGKISQFAGSYAYGYYGNGVLATLAILANPLDIVEFGGYVYIADAGNSCVRRVNLMTNIIEDFVGVCGSSGYGGDNNPMETIQFNGVMGLAISETGRYMYISDTSNNKVRMYDMIYRNITTVAGDGNINTVGAAKVSLGNPQGLVLDGYTLFVVEAIVGKLTAIDLNTRQMQTVVYDPTLYPTKLVKFGETLYMSSANGQPILAYEINTAQQAVLNNTGINSPYAYLIDSFGNVIVSERTRFIYNRTSNAVIAGECSTKYFVRNNEPTLANNTNLNTVSQFIVDKQSGELRYAYQAAVPFIHKYTNGISTIIAGNGRTDSFGISYVVGETLAINSPVGTSISLFENSDNLYFANTTAVMKIDVSGVMTTIIGGYHAHNEVQYGGLASNSSIKIGSVMMNDSKIFIGSVGSIFTVDSNGILDVFVGNDTLFGKSVNRLSVDPIDGNIVFYDSVLCNMYKIMQNKSLITLFGKSDCITYSNETDLTPETYSMRLNHFAFFSNGDMAILEKSNQCIRRWYRSSNTISTIIGTPGKNEIILFQPNSLSITNDGSIIVADSTIRKYVISGCTSGWYGKDCLTPVFDVKFYSTVTYTNTSVKVVLNYAESFKSVYQSATYEMKCKNQLTTYFNTPLNIQSFTNPLIISIDKFMKKGNYSCSITATLGTESFTVDFSNTLQVMEYESVFSESFLKTLPISDVATIASNKDTYSKSTNVVQVLELVTNAISTLQRNASNADETLKVTEALSVITSQSQVSSTILNTISNLAVNISKELSQLDSNTLKTSSASYESTLSNVLMAYSNCYSSQNFNISSESNSIIEKTVMVATRISSQSDSIFQVVTASFIVSVARNINQSIVSDGNTTVVTPSELSTLKDISIGSVTYLNVEKLASLISGSVLSNNYSYNNLIGLAGTSFVNLAKVTDLKYISNGQVLNVSNLSNPISIKFNVDKSTIESIQSNSTQLTISCKYFDETERLWKTDGCKTLVDQSNGIIDCQCNHTTTFSAFLQFTKYSSIPLTIGKIVVSSILIVLAIVAIVGLIITSRRNPTKSRWYLPYFALVSLIIELLFSVIIPGSMLLDRSGDSSIVQSVFTMISCTFYCLSLLNYLMFNLRYITFKYVYELMAILSEKKETQTDTFLKWTKIILTNKFFSIVWNAVIALFIIIYFVIFISLMGRSAIDGDTYTKIMSSSLFAFVMTISLLVCVIYAVDIYMELRYVQLNSKLKETDKKLFINPIKNYFIVNDNLSFRKEFALFFISIAFYVISNAMGFSYLTSQTSLNARESYLIVGYIFEVIYNLLLILSFGGLVSIISIYEYLASKKGYTSQIGNEDVEEDNQIKDILIQPILCQVFEQFAKTEHSLENVIFWKKLYPILEEINRGNIPSMEDLEKEFTEWNENFVATNSPMEINFSHHIKKSFNSQFELIKSGKIESDDLKETLKDMYCALMVNLDDTFSRFFITSSYQQMNKLFELKEQMGSALKQ